MRARTLSAILAAGALAITGCAVEDDPEVVENETTEETDVVETETEVETTDDTEETTEEES
jgi:hypothetical protein